MKSSNPKAGASAVALMLADAFNERQRLTTAFGILVDLIDQASLSDSGVDLCSQAGAELLGLFQREYKRNDELMAAQLKQTGVQVE